MRPVEFVGLKTKLCSHIMADEEHKKVIKKAVVKNTDDDYKECLNANVNERYSVA